MTFTQIVFIEILIQGWSKPLPSKQWSGYLSVGKEKKRHLHYYFIASEGRCFFLLFDGFLFRRSFAFSLLIYRVSRSSAFSLQGSPESDPVTLWLNGGPGTHVDTVWLIASRVLEV